MRRRRPSERHYDSDVRSNRVSRVFGPRTISSRPCRRVTEVPAIRFFFLFCCPFSLVGQGVAGRARVRVSRRHGRFVAARDRRDDVRLVVTRVGKSVWSWGDDRRSPAVLERPASSVGRSLAPRFLNGVRFRAVVKLTVVVAGSAVASAIPRVRGLPGVESRHGRCRNRNREGTRRRREIVASTLRLYKWLLF